MRAARVAAVVLLGLFGATAHAEPVPAKAVVSADGVVVRAGPSESYQPTGQLRRGDEVHVRGEEQSWLAIEPPPGSISWVNDRFVKFLDTPAGSPPMALILVDQVPIRVGSDHSREPLPVEPVKVMRGTLVRMVGPKVTSDNSTWWPIEPTAAEVRYVLRNAVAPAAAPAPAALVASAPLPAAPGVVVPAPLPGSLPPAAPVAAGEPLEWAQAQQAEQAGNYGQAEQLYAQLAQKMAGPGGDHDLAIRCYNRIQTVRARMRAAAAYTPPATAADRPPAPTTTSVSRTPPAAPPPAAPAASAGGTAPGSAASGPGWLRKAGFQIDGQPTYVLENNNGYPRLYITSQPGVNLEPYLNRMVEVYGPMVYRGDVRGGNYLSATRVNLLQ